MARYSVSASKTSGAAAAWVFQLRQPSTTRSLRVFEVGLFTTTAVAATVTLERSNSIGATFTTTTVGTAEDTLSGAASGTVDTAITTAPTRAATPVPFRLISTPAAAGSGAIWTFPTGLVVPSGGGLVIWQTTTAAVGYVCYFAWDE